MEPVTITLLSDVETATIVAGSLLIHKEFSFAKIAFALKARFPNIQVIPVSPGTEAYTLYGANTSYVIATT